jgi:hypothetical protein
MTGQFGLQFRLPLNHRVLLRAANLRHGTDGFTSPPKEGMLWIFSPVKSDGFEPAIVGTISQHANQYDNEAAGRKRYWNHSLSSSGIHGRMGHSMSSEPNF